MTIRTVISTSGIASGSSRIFADFGTDIKLVVRQGSSVSQFVREAALMRARMASDNNPYPMRALAEELRAIGDQGYALAEKALKVAEDEAERRR